MKWLDMEKKSVLLGIIIAFAIIGVYSLVSPHIPNIDDSQPSPDRPGYKLVTKIIDGDTVVVEGEHVRLIGIDADERGYPCHDEAKDRLEEYVLNEEVFLEADKSDKDQYDRYLRYIFLDGKNINLQLVKEGLAVARFFPDNVKYKEEIIAAEKEAIENKIGCKWGDDEPEPTRPLEWTELTEESTGLKVVGACSAGNYTGEEIIVEGRVVDGYKHEATAIFLNFEKGYPNQCFTAVIWADSWHRFPEDADEYYGGETVRVRGEMIEYDGRVEIVLEDTSQIEVG